MNWGKSIILVFVLFAGFIGTMVVLMTRERVDLVRDDYYQTEVAYQQQIDRLGRTAKLAQAPALYPNDAQQQLDLHLPAGWEKGKLTFYRPNDRRLDRTVSLQPGQTQVSTATLAKGHWRIELNWSVGSQEFYCEQPFVKP